ncbi:MAG: HAD-IA family hydrolase [Oscillospiraceae bacterium]|nr:HAD-IA family hydrolase [Oscillospiraceae bacterium]
MAIKAVVFDMYETLITHYQSPLYFGAEMAADAGIPKEDFFRLWRDPDIDRARTVGEMTLDELLRRIFAENGSPDSLVGTLIARRTAAKEECFRHLHEEILPLLNALRERGVLIALISNCYEEEAKVIRKSLLMPFFDRVYLSCEQGVAKPDEEIFLRCMRDLSVRPEECLYVGDGGSFELETAGKLGMRPVQAAWYLQQGSSQPAWRKPGFPQAETPLDLLRCI